MLGITPAPRQGIDGYTLGGDIREHRFNPYKENGGTVAAIAGDDFVIIASDTRLTNGGYGIMSRNQSKLFQLSDKIVLGATGCWADVLTLTKMIEARIQIYKYTHNQEIATSSTAQMLSNMLYAKRFFPYYVSNVLAGIKDDGKGAIYHYDPVGSMEELTHSAGGAAVCLVQPFLDNQVGKNNRTDKGDEDKRMSLDEAERCIHDAFVSAAERHIHVGDAIHFKIVTKQGIEEKTVALRKD